MQYLLLILTLGASLNCLFAQDETRMINMNGEWKFTIGDNQNFAAVNFDDSKWDMIRVNSAWENEGYNDYNGYAWYRTNFTVGQSAKSRNLVLQLGNIDDVDEVYLNGVLIGRSGSFPPNYETAYDQWRRYPVPTSLLKYSGQNVLAVRVFDEQLEGGMLNGEVGIYASGIRPTPDYDLSGSWKFAIWNFTPGEDEDFTAPPYNEKKWRDILVPGFWEKQGAEGYDGIAYYRKNFTLPSYLKGKPLVIMLGKIDDLDMVYINGKYIGGTGNIKPQPSQSYLGQYYKLIRGYYIPAGIINENRENTIVVCVYDGYIDGGIYEGPVGLIAQDKYAYFWKSQKNKSIWEKMLDGE